MHKQGKRLLGLIERGYVTVPLLDAWGQTHNIEQRLGVRASEALVWERDTTRHSRNVLRNITGWVIAAIVGGFAAMNVEVFTPKFWMSIALCGVASIVTLFILAAFFESTHSRDTVRFTADKKAFGHFAVRFLADVEKLADRLRFSVPTLEPIYLGGKAEFTRSPGTKFSDVGFDTLNTQVLEFQNSCVTEIRESMKQDGNIGHLSVKIDELKEHIKVCSKFGLGHQSIFVADSANQPASQLTG